MLLQLRSAAVPRLARSALQRGEKPFFRRGGPSGENLYVQNLREKEYDMTKKWDKIEEALDRGAAGIASGAFIIMIAVITLNVLSRYLFRKSFNWAEEIAYLCFNWSVFFGVAVVYRYQGLTAIDLVVDKLKGRVRHTVLVLGYLLVTLTNLGLIVWGIQFSIVAWDRKSPSLHIPYTFYDLSIPLAAVLLLAYSTKFLIRAFRGEELRSAALEDRV